jgi:hypothetical protein
MLHKSKHADFSESSPRASFWRVCADWSPRGCGNLILSSGMLAHMSPQGDGYLPAPLDAAPSETGATCVVSDAAPASPFRNAVRRCYSVTVSSISSAACTCSQPVSTAAIAWVYYARCQSAHKGGPSDNRAGGFDPGVSLELLMVRDCGKCPVRQRRPGALRVPQNRCARSRASASAFRAAIAAGVSSAARWRRRYLRAHFEPGLFIARRKGFCCAGPAR